ncbi:MAG: serine/threonine-protein kinase [Myxococcota bacterium]
MADDKPPLWTGDQVEGWTVERVIARGGMAWVYHVSHPDRGEAALKVLDPRLVSEGSKQRRWLVFARFKREGRIQSRLRHENIVAVYDTMDVDGTPALLMELVDGPALDEVLEQRDLSIAEIDAIADGIFAGIRAAHEEGVLHRDLKPSNILLDTSGDTPVAKVADFGIAKDQASDLEPADELPTELTRTGQVMGTPSYMAPRQAADSKHVDEIVDCFALGILFHELCTRRRIADEGKFVEAPAVENAVRALRKERRLPRRMVRAIEASLSDDPPFDSASGMAEIWRTGRIPRRPGVRGLVLAAVALVVAAAVVGWGGQVDFNALARLPDWVSLEGIRQASFPP